MIGQKRVGHFVFAEFPKDFGFDFPGPAFPFVIEFFDVIRRFPPRPVFAFLQSVFLFLLLPRR